MRSTSSSSIRRTVHFLMRTQRSDIFKFNTNSLYTSYNKHLRLFRDRLMKIPTCCIVSSSFALRKAINLSVESKLFMVFEHSFNRSARGCEYSGHSIIKWISLSATFKQCLQNLSLAGTGFGLAHRPLSISKSWAPIRILLIALLRWAGMPASRYGSMV